MTDAAQQEASARDAPNVAIRAKPPSPKRLSRKALLAGTIIAGAIIAFALVSGLSERPDRRAAEQQDAVAAASGPPESIRGASDQYGALDLADPGLESDPETLPAEETALTLEPPRDPMWANTPATGAAAATSNATASDPQAVARASPILFAGDEARRGEAARDDERLDARLTPPGSRYDIKSGDVIPAALITALNSDQPGRVIAQVTAPVFDTVSGRHLLIPQGSRLIGAYESGPSYGDNRMLLVWNRLILPSGWSINLRDMNATDPTGAAGLRDRTDNHLDRLGVAIGLSAIISVIANEAEDDDDDGSLAQSVGDAASQQAAQSGGRIVDRDLAVRPTLRVRAGAPVRVLVTRDITLRPYLGTNPN